MKIAGITISHPDKLMYPGISKADVISYYEAVASRMLPYLKDRPLTLERFPDGIKGQGFYQKHAQDYYPSYIKRVKVETREGEAEEIVCNNLKSLIYLANQGTLSFHIWLSRVDMLQRPDKVILDLDPSVDDFKMVRKAASLVGDFLKAEGKKPKLMTTGKSGLHVYYEQRRTKEFDQVRAEVREMAENLAEAHPNLLTTEVRKNKRGNRVFLDYLRNAYAQTAVCPYSLRPVAVAGLACPLPWRLLARLRGGDHFTLDDFRKGKLPDSLK